MLDAHGVIDEKTGIVAESALLLYGGYKAGRWLKDKYGKPPPPEDPDALPQGWTEHKHRKTGKTYYHNKQTKKSVYDKPKKEHDDDEHEPQKASKPPARKPAHAEHEDHEHVEHEDDDEPTTKQRAKYSVSKAGPQGTPGTLLDAGKQSAGKKGGGAVTEIFGSSEEKKLHTKLKEASKSLGKRKTEVRTFVDEAYSKLIANWDTNALAKEGSKQTPPIVFTTKDKTQMKVQLVSADLASKNKAVLPFEISVDALIVAMGRLTQVIESSRTTFNFKDVDANLDAFSKTLQASKKLFNLIIPHLKTDPNRRLEKLALSSFAACRAGLDAYRVYMKKMKTATSAKK